MKVGGTNIEREMQQTLEGLIHGDIGKILEFLNMLYVVSGTLVMEIN